MPESGRKNMVAKEDLDAIRDHLRFAREALRFLEPLEVDGGPWWNEPVMTAVYELELALVFFPDEVVSGR